MLKNFYKYQSVGNDFVLFDWYKKPKIYADKILNETDFSCTVAQICDRHFGVGADGILILKGDSNTCIPEMLIFNKDGSQAEICLNGLRCIAQHLFFNYNFPEEFDIRSGNRIIKCFVQCSKENLNQVTVRNNVGSVQYFGQKSIDISVGQLSGYYAAVENFHFAVFEQVDLNWLERYGAEIENCKSFPNRVNIECVWKDRSRTDGIKKFNSIVYERGCGITLACSSGATAITGILYKLGLINKDEEFQILMPGGVITSKINDSENIILNASSTFNFSGTFNR